MAGTGTVKVSVPKLKWLAEAQTYFSPPPTCLLPPFSAHLAFEAVEERRSPTPPPRPQESESRTTEPTLTQSPPPCAQGTIVPPHTTQMPAVATATSMFLGQPIPAPIITPVVVQMPPLPPTQPDIPTQISLGDLQHEMRQLKEGLQIEKQRRERVEEELKREKEFTSNLAESTRTHMEREVQKLVNAAMQEARQRHRDEVNELKEGIRKLKEEAKDQKEEHKQQMEGTKNNFTQKVEQLNSKINDLNQALTALQQQVGAVQAQVAAGAAAAAPAVAPLAAVPAAAPPSPYKQWRQQLQATMGMAKACDPARHKVACTTCNYDYGRKKVTMNAHVLHLKRQHNIDPRNDVGPGNDGRQWLPIRLR